MAQNSTFTAKSGAVLEADLRAGRLHSDRRVVPCHPDTDGRSITTGKKFAGAGGLRQSQPRQAELRLVRHGTYSHLSMEDRKQRTGVDIQHVPYRGAAPELNGLLGNEVSVLLPNLSSIEEHPKAGKKVRLVAASRSRKGV